MQNSNSNIKVSVCVVTYNQEKYIGECLESLVTQKTDFPFEIIVGDDASTDNTPNIIQEYQQKYPDIIIPILRQENLGPVGNIVDIYKRAKGKYIAHLDGDDMALPGKLQIQADTLDANPDCSICVHNMKAIDEYSNNCPKVFNDFSERKYSLIDLYLINPFFIHSSKMFVNRINEYINKLDVNALDLEVHIEQAKQGDIYLLEKELGCYRQFVGVTYIDNKNNSRLINPMIPTRVKKIYEAIDLSDFNREEYVRIKKKHSYILLKYSAHYLLHNDLKESEKFLTLARNEKIKHLFYYPYKFLFTVPFLRQPAISLIKKLRFKK